MALRSAIAFGAIPDLLLRWLSAGINKLARALSTNPRRGALEKMKLRGCGLADSTLEFLMPLAGLDGEGMLLKMITKFPTVRERLLELDLSDNELDLNAAEAVAAYVRGSLDKSNPQLLVVGSFDNTASIHNTASILHVSGGDVLRKIQRAGCVTSVAWSCDNKYVAVGSEASTAILVDVTTPSFEIVGEIPRGGKVTSVAWSHTDSKLLAIGSSDCKMAVFSVEDCENPKIEVTCRGIEVTCRGEVLSIAWSNDGSQLAVGSRGRTAEIVNAGTDQERGTVLYRLGCGGSVLSVAWSQDDQYLSLGSSDMKVAVISVSRCRELGVVDIDTSKVVVSEIKRGGEITSVAWSRMDNFFLAVGSADKMVAVIKIEGIDIVLPPLVDENERFYKHEVFYESKRDGEVSSVAFSSDDKRLAVGSGDKTVMHEKSEHYHRGTVIVVDVDVTETHAKSEHYGDIVRKATFFGEVSSVAWAYAEEDGEDDEEEWPNDGSAQSHQGSTCPLKVLNLSYNANLFARNHKAVKDFCDALRSKAPKLRELYLARVGFGRDSWRYLAHLVAPSSGCQTPTQAQRRSSVKLNTQVRPADSRSSLMDFESWAKSLLPTGGLRNLERLDLSANGLREEAGVLFLKQLELENSPKLRFLAMEDSSLDMKCLTEYLPEYLPLEENRFKVLFKSLHLQELHLGHNRRKRSGEPTKEDTNLLAKKVLKHAKYFYSNFKKYNRIPIWEMRVASSGQSANLSSGGGEMSQECGSESDHLKELCKCLHDLNIDDDIDMQSGNDVDMQSGNTVGASVAVEDSNHTRGRRVKSDDGRVSLELPNAHIGLDGLGVLANFIAQPAHFPMHALDLTDNEIDLDGLRILAAALLSQRQRLDVSKHTPNAVFDGWASGCVGARDIEPPCPSEPITDYTADSVDAGEVKNDDANSERGYIYIIYEPLLPVLRRLILVRNGIDNEGANIIADALRYNRALELLDLSGNQITSKGVEYLARALEESHVLHNKQANVQRAADNGLTESDCDCDNRDGSMAGKLAMVHDEQANNAQEATVGDASCSDAGASSGLRALLLADNSLAESDCGGLLRLFRVLKAAHLKRLEQLNLARALGGMKKDCAKVLGEMLEQNKTLRKIDLSGNRLSAETTIPIFEKLAESPGQLDEILFSNNIIDNQSIYAVAECLQKSDSLLICDLSNTSMTSPEMGLVLHQAIAANNVITKVTLTGNHIGHRNEELIKEHLKLNKERRQVGGGKLKYCQALKKLSSKDPDELRDGIQLLHFVFLDQVRQGEYHIKRDAFNRFDPMKPRLWNLVTSQRQILRKCIDKRNEAARIFVYAVVKRSRRDPILPITRSLIDLAEHVAWEPPFELIEALADFVPLFSPAIVENLRLPDPTVDVDALSEDDRRVKQTYRRKLVEKMAVLCSTSHLSDTIVKLERNEDQNGHAQKLLDAWRKLFPSLLRLLCDLLPRSAHAPYERPKAMISGAGSTSNQMQWVCYDSPALLYHELLDGEVAPLAWAGKFEIGSWLDFVDPRHLAEYLRGWFHVARWCAKVESRVQTAEAGWKCSVCGAMNPMTEVKCTNQYPLKMINRKCEKELCYGWRPDPVASVLALFRHLLDVAANAGRAFAWPMDLGRKEKLKLPFWAWPPTEEGKPQEESSQIREQMAKGDVESLAKLFLLTVGQPSSGCAKAETVSLPTISFPYGRAACCTTLRLLGAVLRAEPVKHLVDVHSRAEVLCSVADVLPSLIALIVANDREYARGPAEANPTVADVWIIARTERRGTFLPDRGGGDVSSVLARSNRLRVAMRIRRFTAAVLSLVAHNAQASLAVELRLSHHKKLAQCLDEGNPFVAFFLTVLCRPMNDRENHLNLQAMICALPFNN